MQEERIVFFQKNGKVRFIINNGDYLVYKTPNRQYSGRCAYKQLTEDEMDQYDEPPLMFGKDETSVDDLTASAERNGAELYPEEEPEDIEAAWHILGADEYIYVAEGDEGYLCQFYDQSSDLMDETIVQADSMLEARNIVLLDASYGEYLLEPSSFGEVIDRSRSERGDYYDDYLPEDNYENVELEDMW